MKQSKFSEHKSPSFCGKRKRRAELRVCAALGHLPEGERFKTDLLTHEVGRDAIDKRHLGALLER
jgi:hypothetical protein